MCQEPDTCPIVLNDCADRTSLPVRAQACSIVVFTRSGPRRGWKQACQREIAQGSTTIRVYRYASPPASLPTRIRRSSCPVARSGASSAGSWQNSGAAHPLHRVTASGQASTVRPRSRIRRPWPMCRSPGHAIAVGEQRALWPLGPRRLTDQACDPSTLPGPTSGPGDGNSGFVRQSISGPKAKDRAGWLRL